jgi:hypothetical protein
LGDTFLRLNSDWLVQIVNFKLKSCLFQKFNYNNHITLGLSNLELFLAVKTFPNLCNTIGDSGAYWLYAAVCFTTIIFVLMCVPETRGKSLQASIRGLSINDVMPLRRKGIQNKRLM